MCFEVYTTLISCWKEPEEQSRSKNGNLHEGLKSVLFIFTQRADRTGLQEPELTL